jgi:hypothetical protein
VLNFTNNVAASGSRTAIALPATFTNSATARIRFYYHNGSGGTTGSRPKLAIDNLSVTGTPSGALLSPGTQDDVAAAGAELMLSRPTPNPSAGATLLRFSLPQAGVARIEVMDLAGRRVWGSEAMFAPGAHSVQWDGRDSQGAVVPAGVYFVRLATPWGTRMTRAARL